MAGAGGLEPPNGGIKIHLVRIIHQYPFPKIAAIQPQWVQEVSGYFGMPGSMSAHLGARRPALLALRRRIPSARQPAEAFRLPGAVVAGAGIEPATYGL